MLFFLDIDGVMVPAKSWKSPELLEDGFPAFSNKAINAFQKLLSADTTVILTTSHKSNFSIDEWKMIFRNRGINIENLKSLPDNTTNLSRKDEIINWFEKNQYKDDFIIFDDDKALNDLPEFLKNNLIQTSSQIGLTEDHLDEVQSILDKHPNFHSV